MIMNYKPWLKLPQETRGSLQLAVLKERLDDYLSDKTQGT